MAIKKGLLEKIENRMHAAEKVYGPFASSHEALGVAMEEWSELGTAIRANRPADIVWEALDLASVLIRLADQIASNKEMQKRSGI